jgi:hypothetical protein
MRKLALLCLIAVLLPLFAFAGDQVPYKATLASTSFNIVYPSPGADTGRCANIPIPLPPGLGWGLITITAVGNSTHMGLVTDTQSHCTPLPVDPTTATPPPIGFQAPFLLGQAFITGANGDSIKGTYEGILTITDAGMIIDGQLTTYNGTGRFAGAKGIGRAYGRHHLDRNHHPARCCAKELSPADGERHDGAAAEYKFLRRAPL